MVTEFNPVVHVGGGNTSARVGALVLVRSAGEVAASPNTGMHVISPTKEPTDSALGLGLCSQYLHHRLALSTQEKWLPGSKNDNDRYDVDPGTVYILRTLQDSDGNEVFASGIRFTRIHGKKGVVGSLTWSMMDKNRDMQSAILNKKEIIDALKTASDEGRLWDMTRLVLRMDDKFNKRNIIPTMRELFGKGLYITAYQTGQKPLWFFLINKKSLEFLENSGIETKIIHSQEVSEGDRDPSHFCIINPVEAYRKLQELALSKPDEYQKSLDDVTRGLNG